MEEKAGQVKLRIIRKRRMEGQINEGLVRGEKRKATQEICSMKFKMTSRLGIEKKTKKRNLSFDQVHSSDQYLNIQNVQQTAVTAHPCNNYSNCSAL